MRFFSLYQYAAPALLFPLSYWAWWRRCDGEHLCAAFMLAIPVLYAYVIEIFVGWYSGDRYEMYQHLVNRPFGWYAWSFWLMMFCNCVATQVFWSKT